MKACVYLCLSLLISACSTQPITKPNQGDETRLALAHEYLVQNQINVAHGYLLSVSQNAQKGVLFHRLMALYWLKSGDQNQAIAYHESSLGRFPNDGFLLNNYGVLLQQIGAENEACEAFEKSILASRNRSQSALINHARCALRQEDVKKAWLRIKQAKEIGNLPYIGLLTELNLVLIQGNYSKAHQINNIIQANSQYTDNEEYKMEYECLSRRVLVRESDLTSSSKVTPFACLHQGITNNEN